MLKTPETVGYEIFREILRLARQYDANEILVLASQVVVDMLLDEESTSLADLQEFMGKPIRLQVESSYQQELYDIVSDLIWLGKSSFYTHTGACRILIGLLPESTNALDFPLFRRHSNDSVAVCRRAKFYRSGADTGARPGGADSRPLAGGANG